MKTRMAYLIQAVFAMFFAVALSFGASQAFASGETAAKTCPAMGYDYSDWDCGVGCPRGIGYCSEAGICRCGQIP